MADRWKLNRPQLAGLVFGVILLAFTAIASSQCRRHTASGAPVVIITPTSSDTTQHPGHNHKKSKASGHTKRHTKTQKKTKNDLARRPIQRNYLDETVNHASESPSATSD